MKNRLFAHGSVVSTCILLIACTVFSYVLYKKSMRDDIYIQHIEMSRKSQILQTYIADLSRYSHDVASESSAPFALQVKALTQIQKNLSELHEIVSQHIQTYRAHPVPEEAVPQQEAFLSAWEAWYGYDQKFFAQINTALATPSPQTFDALYRDAREVNRARAKLVKPLNDSLLNLTDAVTKWSAIEGAQVQGDIFAMPAMTIFVIGFVAIALGLFVSLPGAMRKIAFAASNKTHMPRDQNADENVRVNHFKVESGDTITALDAIAEKLYESFKSIQGKMQEVSCGVETLAYSMQQVATDQSNLFNLNAAIESACPRQDGFSVVAGEISELAGRSQRLTGSVTDVANTVRVAIEQVATEFGRVLDLVESMQTMMLNMDLYVQTARKKKMDNGAQASVIFRAPKNRDAAYSQPSK